MKKTHWRRPRKRRKELMRFALFVNSAITLMKVADCKSSDLLFWMFLHHFPWPFILDTASCLCCAITSSLKLGHWISPSELVWLFLNWVITFLGFSRQTNQTLTFQPFFIVVFFFFFWSSLCLPFWVNQRVGMRWWKLATRWNFVWNKCTYFKDN